MTQQIVGGYEVSDSERSSPAPCVSRPAGEGRTCVSKTAAKSSKELRQQDCGRRDGAECGADETGRDKKGRPGRRVVLIFCLKRKSESASDRQTRHRPNHHRHLNTGRYCHPEARHLYRHRQLLPRPHRLRLLRRANARYHQYYQS